MKAIFILAGMRGFGTDCTRKVTSPAAGMPKICASDRVLGGFPLAASAQERLSGCGKKVSGQLLGV
jgi:hypothetical protein